MQQKHRLIGPPGTGKTTFLVSKMDDLMSNYTAKEIAYCSFTKAAVTEAAERVIKAYDLNQTDTRWFRTIHSIGAALLEFDHTWKMVDDRDKESFLDREFGGMLSFKSSGKTYDEEEGMAAVAMTSSSQKIDGTWLFKINEYLLLNHPDRWEDTEFLRSILDDLLDKLQVNRNQSFGNPQEIIEFCKLWDAHKKNKKLYEFIDMLYETWVRKLVPPVKVLIVDEFQDLTRIQYLLFEMWAESMEEIWIAGDPNQAIYGFGGGSPKYLNNYTGNDVNTVFLDISHRLPKKLLSYAREILPGDQWLEQLDTANENQGVLRDLYNIDQINFESYDSVFVLARTNGTVKEVADELSKYTIFKRLGVQYDLTDAFVELYTAFRKYRYDQTLSISETERLLTYAKNIVVRGTYTALKILKKGAPMNQGFEWMRGKKQLSVVEIQKLFKSEATITPQDLYVSLSISLNHEAPLRLNFLNIGIKNNLTPEEFTNPSVTLGTIHKSKGKEADLVVLVTRKNYYEDDTDLTDPEEERRVWYVGATRARKELFLLNSYGTDQATKFLPDIHTIAQYSLEEFANA